jgi:polysaccharide biosynthesis protein PslH
MKRHKLLFVTDAALYPLDRGNRLRILNLIRACASRFDVTLVAPKPDSQYASILPDGVTQTLYIDPNERAPLDWKLLCPALRAALGVPFTKSLFTRMRLLKHLQVLDLKSFDLIWAERPHIALIFHAHRVRTVVDFDDVMHRKIGTLIPLQGWSLARLRAYYAYFVFRRAELSAFRDYLRIIVCSRDDQRYLMALGAGNVLIVPNGTEVSQQSRSIFSRPVGAPLRIVFLGNMSNPANIDAVRFFADQVLPIARSLVDSFDVIGSKASPELIHDYGDRVRFVGFVEDLKTSLGEYDAMVVPLRFGGGTKLKALDAMASRLPMISTPCGLEGLELDHGVHALVASTPAEFVDALGRMARSDDLRRDLANCAYERVLALYSWESIRNALGQELSIAVGPKC